MSLLSLKRWFGAYSAREWMRAASGGLLGIVCASFALHSPGATKLLAVGALGVVVAGMSAFEPALWGALFALGVLSAELGFSFKSPHMVGLWLLALTQAGVFVATRLRFGLAVGRAESAAAELVEAERSRIRDAVRSFRLPVGETQEPAESEAAPFSAEQGWQLSSVESLQQSLQFVLKTLGQAHGLRTVALLWIDPATPRHLVVREAVSPGISLQRGPFSAAEGILAAALTSRQPVVIEAEKAAGRMPLYSTPIAATNIVAIPLFERDVAVGVLLADTEGGGLHANLGAKLWEASEYILSSVTTERFLLCMDRERSQQQKLYQGAQALANAHTEVEVIRAGVESARRFTSFDFAAVTLYHEEDDQHEICAASGETADHLVGATFRNKGGLVAMAIESRHCLPYRGEYRGGAQVVFSPTLAAPELESLLVIPLLVHNSVFGTLVFGSKTAGTLGETVRPTLEVLARHIAVSLANARLVKRLGDLASTDGMTGHLNKRALIETAQQKIRSAARFAKPLSVIVGDIDFFKRVNDNHGHDVGDMVIRGFGAILRRTKRETDAVGRFGGEEFVIVCEETDATGARLLAERIRQELAATVFHAKQGPISVTCSLGVATMPGAGANWEELFKASDEALYAAKNGGRNRVAVWNSQQPVLSAGTQVVGNLGAVA